MRVVALFVAVCGCRVGMSVEGDATIPHGDGLAERIITDAALWPDARPPVRDTAPDRAADAADAIDAVDGAIADAAGDAAPSCELLGADCPGIEGCYPFPFDEPLGDVRCALPTLSDAAAPQCLSQLECDRGSLCTTPFGLGTDCHARCDFNNPRCGLGMDCFPVPAYPGVGVCL